MADVDAIRDGFVAVLSNIAGLHAVPHWPAHVNYPIAWPRLAEGADRQVMGGDDFYRLLFELIIVVGSVQLGIAEGQAKLDPYLATSGAKSIRATLEADRTLNGSVTYLFVQTATSGALEINEQEWIGARVPVEVWAT